MVLTRGMRLWGSENLPEMKTIQVGVNDRLRVKVDGTTYEVTLDAGEYVSSYEHFTSSLPAHINSKLTAQRVPVKAVLGGIHHDKPYLTVLVFEHTASNSSATVDSIGGTAGDYLFGEVFMIEPAIEKD